MVYTPSIPRTWAKLRLADIIVDGQDGIISIPGAPTYTPPYSERRVADTVYIRNREEGYTRRVRQKLDANGGLSSSLQFKTKYGTTTVVTRIVSAKLDEYRRDLAAGNAGLTGQLMDKAGNTGIQTLAAAFLQMHNAPASIGNANDLSTANAVSTPAAPSRKRQRLPSPPPEAAVMHHPAHTYATGFAQGQDYPQAYRVSQHASCVTQPQQQQQPLPYRPYQFPHQQSQLQQLPQMQQYPFQASMLQPTMLQPLMLQPPVPFVPPKMEQRCCLPQLGPQRAPQLPLQRRFPTQPLSSPHPYTSAPTPPQPLVSSGLVSSPNRHKPLLSAVSQPVIVID